MHGERCVRVECGVDGVDGGNVPAHHGQPGDDRAAGQGMAAAHDGEGARLRHGAASGSSARSARMWRRATVCTVAMAEKKTNRIGPARTTAGTASTSDVMSNEPLVSG